jgi:hypothetical protein
MSTHMHRGRLLAATTAVVLAAAPASASALAAVSDGGGAPAAAVQAVRVVQPAPASGGFAWDDALIGAGVGAASVALGTAGAIGVGRSRRRAERGVLLG